MVVLLILVVVWAAVLVPGFVKRRLERESGDSIGDFHRQLRVLQRTGPILVDPAFRLKPPTAAGGLGRRPGAVVSNRRGLILVRPDAAPSEEIVPAEEAGGRRIDPFFHPAACKRRRDVLAGFACAVLGSALLSVVPVLRPMLAVAAFALFATAVYVAMLVRMRSRALERTMKLHYLPERVAPEPAIAVHRIAAR